MPLHQGEQMCDCRSFELSLMEKFFSPLAIIIVLDVGESKCRHMPYFSYCTN